MTMTTKELEQLVDQAVAVLVDHDLSFVADTLQVLWEEHKAFQRESAAHWHATDEKLTECRARGERIPDRTHEGMMKLREINMTKQARFRKDLAERCRDFIALDERDEP